MVHLYFNFLFTKMNTVSHSLSAAADNVDGILTAVNALLFSFASDNQCGKRWLLELFAVGSGHFKIVCIEKPVASLDFHLIPYTETDYNCEC